MKKIFLVLFVLIIGSSSFAVDYNVYKLDNGQTVIIKQVKTNPIVTIDTWIKTGSINENDKNNGVSHFLEHLFFKGTKNRPPGEFDKILESKGAITNAATSKDFTHYYITIPSKDFDLAMELHADMLLNPLVPRKELEKERKVVIEEIAKDANNPSDIVYENLNNMMYSQHPYKRKVIGTSEIIEKITREEILDYYNTHYGPSNMVTVVIGDIDPQYALAKVKENFKLAESRKIVKTINKPEKPLSKKQIKVDYEPTQSGYLLIGYRGVTPSNPNTYALDVLATILGDGRSSVLNQKIKEQQQLAFSISSNHMSLKEDGIFMISANFTPENSSKLQKAIFDEIRNIQKYGVTQAQVDRAVNIVERDTYYSRESISNIASEMGYTTILTGNIANYDNYLKNIKKVTPQEVKKVANMYLGENKCAISLVLPDKKELKPVSNTQVKHTLTLVKESPVAKKYKLDNGSVLLVSQNDINDIVAISIYAKGGDFLEKAKGASYLTSATMLKGTEKYSALELAQVLEENGIKISPSNSADSFSIEVLTVKSQLAKTLDLLDEVVNRATFDDLEIEKSITAKLNSIKKSRDLPMNLALDEYKGMIYENSVYSTNSQLLEKALPKVQREDVLEYYNTIFEPQNLVISVNGNVSAQEVSARLSEIFSKKQGTAFNYQENSSKIPCLASSKTSIKEIEDLQTAWIILGWQTSGLLEEKDRATLEVIDTLLGSGMSSRLFRNLRDQEGLAYQLGSSFSPNILRGSFAMYIGTNPKTLERSKEKMFIEINRLKTEFVSDKELQDAKEKIVGNYLISQETNMDKASSVGWFEASGRGFDFRDKYLKLINEVSASDIVEAANKYFNDNYVLSIVKSKE